MRFYNNTDTLDIDNKSLGVSNDANLDNRGLKISIKHNGQKDQFEMACKIQQIIIEALNKSLSDCSIVNDPRPTHDNIDPLKTYIKAFKY